MDVNIGAQLTTVFTTLTCPYLSGLALESTVLGKLVERVQRPLLRQLFLGLALFSILFFIGYIPQISTIVDGLMNRYDIQESLGNKTTAYVFMVGIETFAVSFILLVILSPFNLLLSRRDASNVRDKELFHE